MFESVILRASDPDAGRRFYETVLAAVGIAPGAWREFQLLATDAASPAPTHGLHIAFVARSREQVNAFWEAGVNAGYSSDGEPGPRPVYSPTYYGGFLLDPDGNSVEAVHLGPEREGPAVIDHLWIRVADLAGARDFWSETAEALGLTIYRERPSRFHLRGGHRSFAVVSDERRLTENLELVFPARAAGGELDVGLPMGNRVRSQLS